MMVIFQLRMQKKEQDKLESEIKKLTDYDVRNKKKKE